MNEQPTADPVACPYCGAAARLVTGAEVYPHRPDLADKPFYSCEPCDAWVGCHPGTTKPLGRLADAKLRTAKSTVHAFLDPEWETVAPKYRGKARRDAYARLAHDLGIAPEECHIGMFDLGLCQRAVAALQTWRGVNG